MGEKAKPVLDVLLKSLGDSSPSVQVAAAEALCGFGRLDDALPVLTRALKHESEWVRLAAVNVLDRLGPKADPAKPAMKEMTEKNEYVKRVLEHALKEKK
jgi:HEAT repeat protein